MDTERDERALANCIMCLRDGCPNYGCYNYGRYESDSCLRARAMESQPFYVELHKALVEFRDGSCQGPKFSLCRVYHSTTLPATLALALLFACLRHRNKKKRNRQVRTRAERLCEAVEGCSLDTRCMETSTSKGNHTSESKQEARTKETPSRSWQECWYRAIANGFSSCGEVHDMSHNFATVSACFTERAVLYRGVIEQGLPLPNVLSAVIASYSSHLVDMAAALCDAPC